MIASLSGRTIKRKLLLIIMLTCTVALLLACAVILLFEVYSTKQILRRNTEVIAGVIGANSSAALSFKDSGKNDAREVLAALKAEPYVIRACLYNDSGEVFATYFREGSQQNTPPLCRTKIFASTAIHSAYSTKSNTTAK